VDTATDEAPDRVAVIEEAMKAEGVQTSTPVQADYFGFDQTNIVYLPDGVSYVQHKTMTEGDRRKYLDQVNREVRVEKITGDMKLTMMQGKERYILLNAAIVGWNLSRDGQPVPFSKDSPGSNLGQFLDKADPKVVDLIEKDIRKHNPWLMAEMSVEDIQRQIDDLEEMKAVKIKEEEGKVS
jgi:hypothetical protein